jgi:UDP-glucose-4-epimerase GalE
MTKILITGGAGYIGSHCCKELAARGYDPVVFDNFSTGHREFVQWGELFEGDLRSYEDVDKCLRKHKPDAVMHFAGFIEVGESVKDPGKYYDNNFTGALQLLKALVGHGIDKFVFSSTAAVYGHPAEVPISESHPLKPVNPYGWTKLLIEQMLADFGTAHGLRWVALRYFNAAGADASGEIGEKHEPESHLIPRILQAALEGRPVYIYGTDYPTADGTCIRDYIHVTDLIEAHVLALQYLNGGNGSDVFNLGQGRGYSVREVIDAACRVTGVNISVENEARRPGDPPELIAGNAKAQRVLGWEPSNSSLDSILRSAFAWHRRGY